MGMFDDVPFNDLSDDELNAILGEVSESIQQRVEEIITDRLAFLHRHYFPQHDLKRPVVKYDLQGHHGGWAIGTHTIRLNTVLLNDPRYQRDMLEQTLPHELAHIVQHQVFPHSRAHGREWSRIMGYLGLPAKRCHQYETVAVRQKSRPYRYYCNCDEPHFVTITLHRRMQKGSMYSCKRCKGRLVKG